MQKSSLKALAVVTSIFFFTSSLSGSFLTIYFKESGLTVPQIALLLLFTFIVIGFLVSLAAGLYVLLTGMYHYGFYNINASNSGWLP